MLDLGSDGLDLWQGSQFFVWQQNQPSRQRATSAIQRITDNGLRTDYLKDHENIIPAPIHRQEKCFTTQIDPSIVDSNIILQGYTEQHPAPVSPKNVRSLSEITLS